MGCATNVHRSAHYELVSTVIFDFEFLLLDVGDIGSYVINIIIYRIQSNECLDFSYRTVSSLHFLLVTFQIILSRRT